MNSAFSEICFVLKFLKKNTCNKIKVHISFSGTPYTVDFNGFFRIQ